MPRLSRICPMLITIAFCFLIAGCKPKANTGSAELPTAAPPSAVGVNATEDETKTYATQLEAAVISKNKTSLNSLLSLDDLALRCFNDIPMTDSSRQSFTAGVRQSLQKNMLVTQVLGIIEGGGTFKFTRLFEVDGRPRARFRLIGKDVGFLYWDLMLSRFPDGKVVIDDIFLWTAGEFLSQTLRRILLPMLAEMNQGTFSKLIGAERLFIENSPKLKSMGEAVRTNDFKRAVAIYKSMPREVRENKTLVMGYVNAASNLNDEEHGKALELYRKLFPKDPAIDVTSIDYFLLKKQWDDALRCLTSVENALGGDPYLNVVRCNILVEASRLKEACEAAEKAVQAEPKMEEAYWARIGVALKEKSHKDTLAWLKKAVEKADQEVEDLTKEEIYADFVKSPEHAEWLKWYKTRKK